MKKKTKDKLDTEIDNYIDRTINILSGNAGLAFVAGEIKASNTMGISYDKPSPDSLVYARAYRQLLVDEGATIINGEKVYWMADREKELREQLFNKIEEGFKEGRKTYGSGSIADDIAEILGVEHWKAQRISRTEVKRIMNAGTIQRYERNKVKYVQVLDNEGENSCEECAKINGQKWDIEYANSHELEHPNCVRSFVPIFDDELPEGFVPDNQIEEEMAEREAINPEFTKQLLESKFSNIYQLRGTEQLIAYEDRDKNIALSSYKSHWHRPINAYLREGENGIYKYLKGMGYRVDAGGKEEYMLDQYVKESERWANLIREVMRSSGVPEDTTSLRGISSRLALEILTSGEYNESGFGSWSTDGLIALEFPLRVEDASPANNYTKYLLKTVLPKGLAAADGVYSEREIITIDGIKYRVVNSNEYSLEGYINSAISETPRSKYDKDYYYNTLKARGYKHIMEIEVEMIGVVE